MRGNYDAGNGNYGWGVTDADMYDGYDVDEREDCEPEDCYDSMLREEEREMMDQMAQFVTLTSTISDTKVLINLDTVGAFVLSNNVGVVYSDGQEVTYRESPKKLIEMLEVLSVDCIIAPKDLSKLKGEKE